MPNSKISYARMFYAISAYMVLGLSQWTWALALQKNLWPESVVYLIFYSAFLLPIVAIIFPDSLIARISTFLSIGSLIILLQHHLEWSHFLWLLQITILMGLGRRKFKKYDEVALLRFGVSIFFCIQAATTLWYAFQLNGAPLLLFADAMALRENTEIASSILRRLFIGYPLVSTALYLALCGGFLAAPWIVKRQSGAFYFGIYCLSFALLMTYFFKDFRDHFCLLTIPLFLLNWPAKDALDGRVRN